MKLGDKASIERLFSEQNVQSYVALGGGAPKTNAVPEPMIAALFSYLLGVRLPGFGTNYLKQSLEFHRPATVGSPLTASVEITRIRAEKHLVDLATTCVDKSGETICTGRALVLAKDVGA